MSVWAWIGIGFGALAALMLLAVLLLGRGSRLPSWRGARMARLSRLLAGISASWLGARVRRLFAGAERKERIDAAQREANARRVAQTMGNMKGAFMKLGQMVSFVSDDIPVEYRTMLQTLQAEAPPMDFALIRDVLESELDRPLERAFAQFDEEPIAAASIGQVHRARLPSGEDVAVKVQYPGVAGAIQADLNNVAVLYRMVGLMYPKLDPKPVVAEFRARISEELDYVREANNQSAFHDLYRDHPCIRVPAVVPAYSTARVLTSEFVHGKRFESILELDEADRDRYGEILFRFVFGSIVRFRGFNGDPHPGNYLFDDDGRIVFLDFGCTKYFPDQMLRNWRKLVRAHFDGDRAAFHHLATQLEFLAGDTNISADLIYDYFSYFYESFRIDREFTFTREYNAESFRMIFKPEGRFEGMQKELNMPGDFVFVNRIQWGVISILGTLGATGNWHRIQREFLYGDEPSTDLAHEIAEWRSGWMQRRGAAGRDVYLTANGLENREPGDEPVALTI